MFALVEKDNHLHLHALFDTQERAEQFLRDIVPLYVQLGYYMDKSLTADSFEIIKR